MDLQKGLDTGRESPSPTESQYQVTAYNVETAVNEQAVIIEIDRLLKRYGFGYRRSYNRKFDACPKNVGFNDRLVLPRPDILEGLCVDQFHACPAREELFGATEP
jgi:hypothetical protein